MADGGTMVKDFKDGGSDDEKRRTEMELTPSLVRSKSKLEYGRLPDDVREVMKAFDTDGSGSVDISELASAAKAYKKSQDTQAQQQKIIVIILGILLLTLGAITGLTFAMIEVAKETKTSSDGTMYAAGSSNVVRTASYDSVVQHGVLTDRTTNQPIGVRMNLESTSLSSLLPNSALKELKFFEATSTGGAYVYVTVNGFLKLPPATAGGLPIVKLLTPYGTVTLEGSQLSFADSVPEVFMMAGFSADAGTRRTLLGVAQLVGWFEMLDAYLSQNPNLNVTMPVPPTRSKSTSWTYVPCGADCEINEEVTDDSHFSVGTRRRHGTVYKVYFETGYTFTNSAGLRMYKAEQTYERFPEITVHEVTNGTHSVRYQVFKNEKYHCGMAELSNKPSDYEGIEMSFKESATYHMSMQFDSADTSNDAIVSIPLDAKSFSMSSNGFPNVTTTYWGHETNVDVPIAISMDPKVDADGRKGTPIVFTEFIDFSYGDDEVAIDLNWFNLEAAMLGCRVERDYNVPPDAMVNAVGSEIVAAPDDWGSLIPDSEKVSREDEVHNEIASTVHESFTNSTDTDRRRSLNRNGLYPQYPYYSTFDGCTHVLDLGGTYSAEFTHWGRATSNAYDCEGPKLKMAGTTTYPPAPLPGLVEMQANVEIAYDRGTRRFSATGCLAVGLACDSTLKRYGLGSIANPVCRWLVVEGNVCALVDYHKWAQCQNGYEYYYVDRYGWWYCARWSWGRCRSWRRHHWRERRSRPRWVRNIASNYRLGVSGQVNAGFDFWWVGANAQAKVDYYYIDARQWQHSGNYMAIYISISAWVGWSRFSSGFQLLPWRGDPSCSNNMMVWDGVPFKKLK